VNEPLVSVLMTAYNREKYIAEAIESVLASTFKDFELIIVDDCSQDRTVEIARRYLTDPRVQLHINEKNLGDYPNRNRAASLAKGKYLKYLDADDLIYPERLSVMVNTMERFPEAGFGLEPAAQDDSRPYPFQISPREAYQRQYVRGERVLDRSPLGIIIRASAFRDVGGFSGKQWVGDFEMWHKLAARFPVVLLTEGGTWYRIHDMQQSSSYRGSRSVRFEYLRIAFEQLTGDSCPLAASERTRAIRKIIRSQLGEILREALRGRVGSAWALLCRCNVFGNSATIVRGGGAATTFPNAN
jgi:glycosyltransferase involved in cell wall biosynthesis